MSIPVAGTTLNETVGCDSEAPPAAGQEYRQGGIPFHLVSWSKAPQFGGPAQSGRGSYP